LNCTIPELANINVGSLRGTSELLGTTRWPLRSKKLRKVERISFNVGMDQAFGKRIDPMYRHGRALSIIARGADGQ
jgi:hypothetical protein